MFFTIVLLFFTLVLLFLGIIFIIWWKKYGKTLFFMLKDLRNSQNMVNNLNNLTNFDPLERGLYFNVGMDSFLKKTMVQNFSP